MNTQVLAFDVYGTLLDVKAIASKISEVTGIDSDAAQKLSATFRTYQLEYTWRLSLMGVYEPFDAVTKRALEHALAEHGVEAEPEVIHAIMDTYVNRLQPAPEAVKALEALSKKANVKIVIFSNGNSEMITSALRNASLLDYADGVFLADMVKLYKPARKVYDSLVEYVNDAKGRLSGVSVTSEDVWLVSGNPFDITGALNAGLKALWVSPAAPQGWNDRAVDLTPTATMMYLWQLQDLF